MVTPFDESGEVDLRATEAVVENFVGAGVDGISALGSTGEFSHLTLDERKSFAEAVVEIVSGRASLLIGVGAPGTREAIELARHAEQAGADALLVVTPYYNKPTQEGLYRHYKAINDAVGIPIIIYNIPGRSVIDMSVETMARLYELKNIAGVKDATANMARVSLQRQKMGPDFIQLSGEDATALGFMAHGGHGCISVTSNVAPALCAQMQEACLRGDFAAALKVQDRLMPLHEAMFIETNPAPAKYALSLLGKCEDTVRLPMVTLADKSKSAVRDAMVHAGLIN